MILYIKCANNTNTTCKHANAYLKKKEKRNTRSSMCVRDSMTTHAEGEAISGLLIYMHACRLSCVQICMLMLYDDYVRCVRTNQPRGIAIQCHPHRSIVGRDHMQSISPHMMVVIHHIDEYSGVRRGRIFPKCAHPHQSAPLMSP